MAKLANIATLSLILSSRYMNACLVMMKGYVRDCDNLIGI